MAETQLRERYMKKGKNTYNIEIKINMKKSQSWLFHLNLSLGEVTNYSHKKIQLILHLKYY